MYYYKQNDIIAAVYWVCKIYQWSNLLTDDSKIENEHDNNQFLAEGK